MGAYDNMLKIALLYIHGYSCTSIMYHCHTHTKGRAVQGISHPGEAKQVVNSLMFGVPRDSPCRLLLKTRRALVLSIVQPCMSFRNM